jgi:hypothetical protein
VIIKLDLIDDSQFTSTISELLTEIVNVVSNQNEPKVVEKYVNLEKIVELTDSVDITQSCPVTESINLTISALENELQSQTEIVSNDAFEMAKNLLEEIGDISSLIQTVKEESEPGPSNIASESPIKEQRKSVVMSTHAVGNNVGNDLRLTESELQLGKVRNFISITLSFF